MHRADIEAVSGQKGWYRTTLKPGWAFYVSEKGDIRIGPAIKIAEHWSDADERFLTVFHACREGIAIQDADPLPNVLSDEAELRFLRAVMAARGRMILHDDFSSITSLQTELETLRREVHG